MSDELVLIGALSHSRRVTETGIYNEGETEARTSRRPDVESKPAKASHGARQACCRTYKSTGSVM